MTWLVAKDRVLATLELAETWQSRMRGVIGRESLDGVILLRPTRAVHTFGVQFPIDVAYCDADLRVLDIVTMSPRRVGMPRRRARSVLEAPRGSFERWHVHVGDQLELRL